MSEISPEQALLQAVITSAVSACVSYQRTGVIKNTPPGRAALEYARNLRALREVDTALLEAAGFRRIRFIMEAINMVLKKKTEMEKGESLHV
jgi:hypothetical protein